MDESLRFIRWWSWRNMLRAKEHSLNSIHTRAVTVQRHVHEENTHLHKHTETDTQRRVTNVLMTQREGPQWKSRFKELFSISWIIHEVMQDARFTSALGSATRNNSRRTNTQHAWTCKYSQKTSINWHDTFIYYLLDCICRDRIDWIWQMQSRLL